MAERISAPFDDAFVASFNASQQSGGPLALTCPTHPDGVLVASTDELRCPVPGCPYTRDWIFSAGQIGPL